MRFFEPIFGAIVVIMAAYMIINSEFGFLESHQKPDKAGELALLIAGYLLWTKG